MRTREEVESILKQAKEMQIESVELDGIKYVLGAPTRAKPAYVEDLKAEEIISPLSVLDEPTEEEVKYYSTPYWDVLQARKEAEKNQKAQDDELKEAANSRQIAI